jgi:hypothetical protein
MIAVAIIAVTFYGGHLWRLSRKYQQIAEQQSAPGAYGWAIHGSTDPDILQMKIRQLREWRAQMEAKYRYAARHPWLPVTNDVPPPSIPGATLILGSREQK